MWSDEEELDWEEEAGRVYVRTLEELGGDLEDAARFPEQSEVVMGDGCA